MPPSQYYIMLKWLPSRNSHCIFNTETANNLKAFLTEGELALTRQDFEDNSVDCEHWYPRTEC